MNLYKIEYKPNNADLHYDEPIEYVAAHSLEAAFRLVRHRRHVLSVAEIGYVMIADMDYGSNESNHSRSSSLGPANPVLPDE